jgi:hypothetical protein
MYGILKYATWMMGSKFKKKIQEKSNCNKLFCRQCKTEPCPKCSSPCECYIPRTESKQPSCVHSSNLEVFDRDKEIEHTCFLGDTIKFKIEEFFYFEDDYGDDMGEYILIFSYENIIFFLFPWGDDINIINIKTNKYLLNIINKINTYKSKSFTKLHLYGHSMGSIYIRYLLSRVNEIIFKDIVVRLSGVFFNKMFIPNSVTDKSIDYWSLNLGLDTGTYLLIDRYTEPADNIGIETKFKDKTYFGITHTDPQKNFSINKINNLTNLRPENPSNNHINREIRSSTDDLYHKLEKIFSFIEA